MITDDLVTVVVPAFNRASTLPRALDSIFDQTYTNWEAIVVDDGSTDQSADAVQEFRRKDARVNLIRHPQRKGAQAARNTGILAANGKWIAFLDSDDVLLPDSLKSRIELARTGLEVVHSNCYVARAGSSELQPFGLPALEGKVYRKLLRKSGFTFPSLLVSKGAIKRIGYLDQNIVAYQEWETAIRLAKYFQFGFVKAPTFIYDCRLEDSISRNRLQDARGYEQVVRKHEWPIVCFLGPKALVHHYQLAADLYLKANDHDNTERCLRKAFSLWPFRPGTILRGIQRLLHSQN